MLHIHITAKGSERFPGKNNLLWGYTRYWLSSELQDLEEPYSVTVTVRGQGLDTRLVPVAWEVLPVHTEPFSHEGDLLAACRHVGMNNGVHVLLQLTQPVRRPGLLRDAVQALRKHPWATVMSSCNRGADGALYAWYGNPARVFARRNPFHVPNVPCKVDVDTPGDLPENLPALWAEELGIKN